MKKPKVIYQKVDNNISEQKCSSCDRPRLTRSGKSEARPVTTGERERVAGTTFCSHFNLVLRRLIHNKKEKSVLDLYSHFLQPLVRRRSSNYIKNARNIGVAGIASSFLLVLLSAAILIPIYNRTNSAEATTGTSKQSDTVLTLDASQSIAAVDLLVKDSNGTFATSSDTSRAKYTVTTNNYTGYTLTITNKSNNTDLVNNDVSNGGSNNGDSNANNTFTSISSAISSTTFDTTVYNGKWGYMPSRYCTSTTISSCTNNTNYRPSPTTTASTLDITDTPNTTAKEYTIGIGARATYTQQAGVYSNTYILQAVGNPINYAITYSDASGDGSVTPTLPAATSGSTSATSITLSSDTPTRSGYEFKGWCGVNNSSDTSACKDSSGNTGTIYQPGDTYGIDQTTTNITTLYAIWQKMIYMQDVSKVSLATMLPSSGNTTTLYDKRDNSDYQITNINGEYWMTQNLRITHTIGQSEGTILGTDSDFSATNIAMISGTSFDSYTVAQYHVPTATDTDTSGNKPMDTYTTDQLGVWYSFCAASAKSGTGACDDSNIYTGAESICPSGWRLPTDSEFSSITSSVAAFNPIYGGYYSYNFLSGAATDGGWWSSTASGVSNQYKLYYSGGSLDIDDEDKEVGYYIRCIKSDDTYMQDLTKSDLTSMLPSTGDSTILTDRRDGSNYKVTNINGEFWMTQNLRITGTISSTDSNFTGSDIDLSTNNLETNGTSGGNCYGTASYSNLCTKDSGDATTGAWYNYCAASADTVCTGTEAKNATEDICPSGWNLPTSAEQSSITAQMSIFNPVYSGYYDNGLLNYATTYGYWWSSTANYTAFQYALGYNGSSLYTFDEDKGVGYSVRCIKNTELYMQDVTKTDLDELLPNAGDTTTLYDNRDNQAYTVGKLADGNYWLLENLRLDLTDSTVLSTLTTANTNIDTTNTPDALDYLRGTKTGTSSDRYATSKVAAWTSTSYTYSAPWIAVDSTTSGKCDSASYCTGNSALTWSSTDSTSLANNGADAYPGKVGIYYNYCAASAGTYCYGNDTSQGSPSGNSVSDICPYGWRIPTGKSGIYQALYTAYNNYANFRSALQVPLSGYFNNGKAYYQGANGYFWSSTRNNSNSMYNLNVNFSGIYSADYNNRYVGNSVRCVFNIPYMQDTTVNMLEEGEERTLYDRRDGSDYTVKKINGYLWMTQNLRFLGNTGSAAGKMTLTSDTSNGAAATIDLYSLASTQNATNANLGVYSSHCDSTNGYNYACVYDSGDATKGVWYNYNAATAGNIKTNSNNTAVSANGPSVCPAGWHLPTGAANNTSSEFYKLFQNTSSNWIATNTYLTAFGAVAGGYYLNGSLNDEEQFGYWWSATAESVTGRYYLRYNGSNSQFRGYNSNYGRGAGFSVRCVRTS